MLLVVACVLLRLYKYLVLSMYVCMYVCMQGFFLDDKIKRMFDQDTSNEN